MRFLLSSFLFLLVQNAWGLQVSDSFSSLARWQSGAAIWNQELGKIHPTLRVMNFKGGFTPKVVAVGDGSHGAFEPSTYAQFSMNGDVTGNVIRLDTSVYPILKVTRFELAQGWTLLPVGSAPLVIYSLSTVDIQGEIWCHGADGEDSVAGVAGNGGVGRCGGADGGDGGFPTLAGANGGDADSGVVTGGQGGNFIGGSYVGGGGGGSWSAAAPSAGGNSSVSGGQAGLNSADAEMLNELGGSGGGGGSGGSLTAGAGGGGGGGVVIIHSVGNFNLGAPGQNYGFIFAGGGRGGNADLTGSAAGPGGGGGGGMVQIFSGDTINIYNNSGLGASRAMGGAGGTNVSAGTGGSGGDGRSWVSSVNYNGVGFYAPPEAAPISPGNVEFNSAQEFVYSKAIDLMSTQNSLETITLSPASPDFVVEVSGSSDNFASDNTGWSTSLASVQNKRYLKFRIGITTSDVNVPTMVDSILIDYQAYSLNDFEFAASGCGTLTNHRRGPGSPQQWLVLMALMVFPVTIFAFLKSKANGSVKSGSKATLTALK